MFSHPELCSDPPIGSGREAGCDSSYPLEIPLGPITRARAKRFKEALNVLIRDAQVEKAHVFNVKEKTKMVHVIKVNLDLDQEPRHFLFFDLLLFWSRFAVELVLICC